MDAMREDDLRGSTGKPRELSEGMIKLRLIKALVVPPGEIEHKPQGGETI